MPILDFNFKLIPGVRLNPQVYPNISLFMILYFVAQYDIAATHHKLQDNIVCYCYYSHKAID